MPVAARIGGEEFVLMLTASSKEGAHKMARSIQQRLAEPALAHAASAASAWLTVSMGIALCDSNDDSPSALLSRAARALYEAKASGRNRFVFDERPMAGQVAPEPLKAQD